MGLAALVVLALVVVGYAVLPTRSWLAQRGDISARETELSELQAENEALQARVEALNTLDEIEHDFPAGRNLSRT